MPNSAPPAPLFYSAKDVAHMLGLSLSGVYNLFDDGRIATARHGRRRLAVASSVHRYAESLPVEPERAVS
jgi:excisionase family DNA binding protein